MKVDEGENTSSATCSGMSYAASSAPQRSGRSSPPAEGAGFCETVYVNIYGTLRRSKSGAVSEAPADFEDECLQTSGFQDSSSKVSMLSKCLHFGSTASMRVGLLLLFLFLLPTLVDILCKRSTEGGPSRVDPTFHFQTNVRGESIYMSKGDARQMTQHRGKRAKAAIVVLARNQDVEDVLLSLTRLEQRFNHKYNYPYVFLNERDFDDTFINRTTSATQARTLYGKIPEEHWSYPPWISQEDAAAARRSMEENGVLYGSRESYHHMCRFYSGFFYKHPLLKEFDYYWRMEPDVHYYCDLDYDPFVFMQENNLKYGFVISILELPKTIPALWETTQKFMKDNPGLIPSSNLMPFVTDRDGSYNLCHFWSNFEIGDLNFFRSRPYEEYFKALDRAGGFFFERWGDAPVHSLGAAMLLNSSEVYFFQDIGYRHNSMKHCPATQRNNCDCDAIEAVRFHTPSYGVCHKRWDDFVASQQRKQELGS